MANIVLKVSPVTEEARIQERSHLCCILSLTVVFLLTYSLSMVISEVYVDLSNVFYFVLVKYIAGIGHTNHKTRVLKINSRYVAGFYWIFLNTISQSRYIIL